MPLTAADIIRLLELQPHPEGGHFRETFRGFEFAGFELAPKGWTPDQA